MFLRCRQKWEVLHLYNKFGKHFTGLNTYHCMALLLEHVYGMLISTLKLTCTTQFHGMALVSQASIM